ncbi:MAG: hypothetical protein U9R19_15465 [Bacteroidota bacterium]|nr:hypothetical protein [Bacteroidota bacterium]
MNYKKFIIVFIVVAISAINYVNGQFTFSVSPGLNLNSASFGFKISDKIVPYFGLQLINAKVNIEEDWEELDYWSIQVNSYSDEITVSGSIIIPNIGVKYFFAEKSIWPLSVKTTNTTHAGTKYRPHAVVLSCSVRV